MTTQFNVTWSLDTTLKHTQERLAIANAVRVISTVLSDLESSCQALLAILRQHEHQARPTAEDLQELAHKSQLGYVGIERVTQGKASPLPPSVQRPLVQMQQCSCALCFASAIAVNMSNWSCKAPAAVAGHHLQFLYSSMTDPAADFLDRSMQHLLYALQQLLHSNHSCTCHHDCSALAKDALLGVISTAFARVPDLQLRSCMAGEPVYNAHFACMLPVRHSQLPHLLRCSCNKNSNQTLIICRADAVSVD